METGIIAKKETDRGFGFITSEKGEGIFFHISDIGNENFQQLTRGSSVTYDYVETLKGKQATRIILNLTDCADISQYKKTMDFSEQQIRELFGDLAAEDEDKDRFSSYFIKTDIYEKIHNFLPIRVLVAHKGIGKSAIFRMSYLENQKNNILSLWVKPNDISNLGKVEGDLDPLELIRQWKSGLEELLINKIISKFNLSNENEILNQVANKGLKLADRIVSIAKKVHDVVDVDAVKKNIAERYLKENKIVIYIDDLDRAWNGSKQNIYRLSALLNAIRDMCNESSELCFRVSLRSDVYYLEPVFTKGNL